MKLMAKLFLAPSIILVSFVLLMSSCSKNEEKVLNVYSRQDIQIAEPAMAVSVYEERLIRQIYETLYEFHYLKEPYEMIPLLAENMPDISSDGLTYTIKIRKGIKFADDPCFKATKGKGRDVDARDFAYSMKYFAASPPFNKAYFMYYIDGLVDYREKAKSAYKKGQTLVQFIKNNEVQGIKVEDEYTVKIKLTQPCPYFLETITVPGGSVIALEALEHYGKDFNVHPVGTGPFMLKSLTKGKDIVLVKNPDYAHGVYPSEGTEDAKNVGLLKDAGKKLPFVDKVVIKIIKADVDRQKAFNKGEIDIYSPEQESFYDYFPKDNELSREYKDLGVQVAQLGNPRFTGIMLNMKNPLIANNKELRKAIVHAFDNEKNIDVFYYEKPITAYWIIPPGIYGYDPNYKSPCTYDLGEAKKSMTKAGYPDGNGMPELTLLLNDNPLMNRVGKFFAESMYKIGIKVKLEFVDTPEKVKQIVEEGKKPVHLFVSAEYSLFSSPEMLLRMFYRGNVKYRSNYSGYYNPEYEKLYEKMVLMDNGPEKLKLLNKMRDMVIEDHAVIPLSFSVLYRLYHGYLQNYKPHVMMFDRYKYINVDGKERKRILKLLSKQK
jgi:oligopeptide transport system substrate-binding protein